MLEEASGTEVIAVAQWQSQQYFLYPSAFAVVAAESHYGDPMSLVVKSRWGPW